MIFRFFLFIAVFVLSVHTSNSYSSSLCDSAFHLGETDPLLHFEDYNIPEVRNWIRAQNRATDALASSRPEFAKIEQHYLNLMNSQEQLVWAMHFKGTDIVRSFWQDSTRPIGFIREKRYPDYLLDPKDGWVDVLDIDQLARTEGEEWQFSEMIYFHGSRGEKGLIELSDKGSDAKTIREFDFVSRSFVEGGFVLPRSKSSVEWLDADTLLVSDALTDGSTTDSGYSKKVRIWSRGTALEDAPVIFEAQQSSLMALGVREEIFKDQYETLLIEYITFSEENYYFLRQSKLTRLNIPPSANISAFVDGVAIVTLGKDDWHIDGKIFNRGDVVYFDFYKFLDAPSGDLVQLLVAKPEKASIDTICNSHTAVYVTFSELGKDKIVQYKFIDHEWQSREIPNLENGSLSVASIHNESGEIFIYSTSYTSPPKIVRLDEKTLTPKPFQSNPESFDSSKYRTEVFYATSKDGTLVPYSMTWNKSLKFDGSNPTIQYGYGGFGVSLYPRYLAGTEYWWLRDGGVYVEAHIRGGGEFGLDWHEAAKLRNRHRAFEDFAAVSEDLIRRGVTAPDKLIIEGGSNGGLLTATMATQYPHLYRAAIAEVPLTDMMRFHLLLTGKSWIAEYGDPTNPNDREYLLSYSPYHNLRVGIKYPLLFLKTSQNDDRVHPGHARKFARMLEEIDSPFIYRESEGGGHGGTSVTIDAARERAIAAAIIRSLVWPAEK